VVYEVVISASNDIGIYSLAPTVIGNTGCGAGYGGVGFGATSLTGCSNYSMLGDGTNTYFNRPTAGQIVFRENSATEMVLAAGGNLGIGTTPQYMLHVNGTARAETGLSLGGNATLAVDAPGVGAGHFTVQPNGTVGINNANPQHALDVNGAVSINGDVPMTSNPRMSFSGFINSSFCEFVRPGCSSDAAFYGGSFVPDRAINITRVSVALGSTVDPSCNNPFPEIVLWENDTLAYVLTIPASTQYIDSGSTPVNLSVPAGTGVYVGYMPDDNCTVGTSYGGYAWVNVQYEMQ
jgi:hypothetical protein